MREMYVFFATNHQAKVNLEVDFVCRITNAVTGGGYEQIVIKSTEENETLSSAIYSKAVELTQAIKTMCS